MRRSLTRVSLFACLALFSTSCNALGIGGTSCDGTEVIGFFDQVGDLPRAANVQSADVEIGTVKDIELDGWDAKVTMCLEPEQRVPADVEAVVRTTSLLGEKFIDLKPQSLGAPYLEDGDTLDTDQTSKATELEDVFAKLAGILGTGNLEQLNRFTSAQAKILKGNAGKVRKVLSQLNTFTGLLADRKQDISIAVDSLDSVSRTISSDSETLRRFLDSFASSAEVLSNNKEGLQSLLISLDRFTNVSARLLVKAERGVNAQLRDLRPILRTVIGDSDRIRETLTTLATFSEYFPESMPGNYLQLDVYQAGPEDYDQDTSCPQSNQNDNPDVRRVPTTRTEPQAENTVEYILRLPLVGGTR